MGNTVLSKRAATDLHRYSLCSPLLYEPLLTTHNHSIKSKQPERFLQVHLFRKTLCILESHHFRLPARRFAIDLFDKSVMRRIVLDEDTSGTDSDSS